MLNLVGNHLAEALLVTGALLLFPLSGLVLMKKRTLTPRVLTHLWFWRCTGFWALVIGTCMVLS